MITARRVRVALAAATALVLTASLTTVKAATPASPTAPQSIYFVVLDRFANGSTANDQGGLSGDSSVTGYDPTDHGYFHGGDIVGLDQKLDYIKSMGFTAIWVTPLVTQQTVQNGSAAYHGYWGLDFTKIDPHFGTAEEFTKMVNDAHSMGLKVILDIVVNHTADVIKYDAGKAYIPTGAPTKNPAWLNDLSNYHNVGDLNNGKSTLLTGDFFGLDDIKTESPVVQQGWTALWSDWITKYHLDGFRIDTAQYVDAGFWNYFLPRVQAAAKKVGINDFQIFGEIAETDPQYVSTFTTEESFPSALDFPLRQAVLDFVTSGNKAENLAEVFNGDDYYTTATNSAANLRTFVSNHDAGRIGYFIQTRDSWAGDGSILKRDLLAQDLLYLLRGVPIGYYGDEVGMAGAAGDKDARQDMFPTQVVNWQTETRIGGAPIGTGSSFDAAAQANPIRSEIQALLALRAKYPDLATGAQQVLYAKGNVLVLSRYANGNEFIEAINSGESDASVDIAPSSTTWETLFGSGTYSSAGTNMSLTIPALHSLVLHNTGTSASMTAKADITLAQPQIANAVAWIPVIATSKSAGINQVSFYTSSDKKKWILQGTADHHTYETANTPGGEYRIFLHPSLLKMKKFYIKAIIKNASGGTATSKVLQVSIG